MKVIDFEEFIEPVLQKLYTEMGRNARLSSSDWMIEILNKVNEMGSQGYR